jgi:hypothetical protein
MRTLLPQHMTEEQRQGFRIGMECVRTWGRQMVTAAYLPSPGDKGEDLAQREVTGRALQTCAEALDRTIGQNRAADQTRHSPARKIGPRPEPH